LINARGGNVRNIDGGFEFNRLSNHRAGYSWFAVNFGSKRLTHYSEIRFNYQFISGGTDSRRVALIASNTALGTANFSAHSSGGSGLAFPNGSDNGFLADGQVSRPILNDDQTASPPIANPETKQEIVLRINPLEATHYHNQTVYFSIYDHVNASVIQITDIVFVEATDCTLCDENGPCECNTIISTAKTIVEGLDFTGGRVNNSSTEANATAYVLSIIEAENVLPAGVTADIETVTFTPWSDSANGSFVFNVKLNRGAGAEQTVDNVTLAIAAFEPEVVWSLVSDLTSKNYGTDRSVGANVGHLNATNFPLLFGEGATGHGGRITTNANNGIAAGSGSSQVIIVDRSGDTPSLISAVAGGSWGVRFSLADFGILTKDFTYSVRIEGTILGSGAGASFNTTDGNRTASLHLVTAGYESGADNSSGIGGGETDYSNTFVIERNLPVTSGNPVAATILHLRQNDAATIRITSIVISQTGVVEP